MREAERRDLIAQVLDDYRNGLLDSVEDGVERIEELFKAPAAANLGHAIRVNPPGGTSA